MRHRVRGRKLGRNASHRKAMFRNMAVSLIRSIEIDEDAPNKPAVPGRIVTTVAKAKELRPFVEKLVTMGRKGAAIEEKAAQYDAGREKARGTAEWREWSHAVAPAVALRRRAFSILRDHRAVQLLFEELAERFADRPGGYTRVVKLAEVRLGDAGQKALIEFVGERDRVKMKSAKREALAVEDAPAAAAPVSEDDTPESDEASDGTTPADETGGQNAADGDQENNDDSAN